MQYRWRFALRLCAVLAVSGGLLASVRAGTATEPADTAAGRAIVTNGVARDRPACASCHMADGRGQPLVGIPRLAGLDASYIFEQLDYFASGSRQNAAMSPFARMLTQAQREEVAEYFAGLPIPRSTEPLDARADDVSRGRVVYLQGDEASNVLACANCHGPSGLGVGDFSPRLAGQSGPYVAEQLTVWRAGRLRDPKGVYMRAEAAHLTAADIEAVAAYIAALPEEGSKR
jgi:cytochrome c553